MTLVPWMVSDTTETRSPMACWLLRLDLRIFLPSMVTGTTMQDRMESAIKLSVQLWNSSTAINEIKVMVRLIIDWKVCEIAFSIMTHRLAERMRANPRISRTLEKLAGVFLVGFGIKLAISK